MPTGTVKWFSDDKGFGFITPDDGDKDLFVHHTGINGEGYRSLREGEVIELQLEGPLPFDQDGCRWHGRSVRRTA